MSRLRVALSGIQASRAFHQDAWAGARPYAEIPGPQPLPGLGNTWRFLPGIGEFHGLDFAQLMARLQENYGPICRLGGMPGRPPLLLVHDVDDIQTIYRTEGTWPVRRGADSLEHYFEQNRKNRLVSLASAQGEEWATFRSAVNPVMMQPRNITSYIQPINDVAQEMVDKMITLRDEQGKLPRDFSNELTKWSLESVAYVSLDTRLGCLKNFQPDSDAAVMIKCVRVVFECIDKLDLQPSLWKFVSTPAYRTFMKHMDKFTEVASKNVAAAMQRLQKISPEEFDNRQHSVLEDLLLRTKDANQAVSMSLDMLLAGVDTTSALAATVIYQLAIHPDKQRKLQEELDRVIPDASKHITKAQLEELRYLRACIKETMRVMPVVSANFRDTGRDVVLSGYQVPKGTTIAMPATVASMTTHFPRANEFLPERWLRTDKELDAPNAFAFLPFGLGPRMCVGKRFAQLETETLVAKVFRNLTVEWRNPPAVTSVSTLLYFKSPLQFTIKMRT